MAAKGTPLQTPTEWMMITNRQFRDYAVLEWDGSTTSIATTASATSAARTLSPASIFKKGIKRDPTLFPVLKRELNFDSWKRSIVTQAKAQGVYEPLDPNYRPTTAEDKELFTEQQIYLTAVFEKTIKTSMGQTL
eukprot:CAMPEP_0178913906 /NCGR_PEP_ID=MMETSP0786-20121207/11110_1 /TAXON_ID=186022 /ORGANISM="Thalassionema frauenfeldii, Strain CCMP 1798" /LENGTH=134 /DNA_ID=CAMNT_0020586715 /DNA_START=1169 /DNA_END=1569 /DNA_ORIENTATION=+